MPSLGSAEHIPQAVDIVASDRTADRIRESEEVGYADIRQRRRPLHIDIRTEDRERFRRIADASSHHARVAQPYLVHGLGGDCPYIAHIGILLPVGIIRKCPSGQGSSGW